MKAIRNSKGIQIKYQQSHSKCGNDKLKLDITMKSITLGKNGSIQ